jgi:hypothetical protein
VHNEFIISLYKYVCVSVCVCVCVCVGVDVGVGVGVGVDRRVSIRYILAGSGPQNIR